MKHLNIIMIMKNTVLIMHGLCSELYWILKKKNISKYYVLTIICIAVAIFARKRIPLLKLNTSLHSGTIRLVETWSWDDCFVVYCKTSGRKVFQIEKWYFFSKNEKKIFFFNPIERGLLFWIDFCKFATL